MNRERLCEFVGPVCEELASPLTRMRPHRPLPLPTPPKAPIPPRSGAAVWPRFNTTDCNCTHFYGASSSVSPTRLPRSGAAIWPLSAQSGRAPRRRSAAAVSLFPVLAFRRPAGGGGGGLHPVAQIFTGTGVGFRARIAQAKGQEGRTAGRRSGRQAEMCTPPQISQPPKGRIPPPLHTHTFTRPPVPHKLGGA